MYLELYVSVQKIAMECIAKPYVSTAMRALLTVTFWGSSILEMRNFEGFTAEMKSASLPFPRLFACVAITTKLICSLLVIGNFYDLGWVAAGILCVFTLLTIPYGHAFWKFSEPRRTVETHIALEHVTVVGGLLMAAATMLR